MKKLGRTIKWILFKINIFIFLLRNYEPWIYDNKKLAIKRAKRLEKRLKVKIYVLNINDYCYELLTQTEYDTRKELVINDKYMSVFCKEKLVYGKE